MMYELTQVEIELIECAISVAQFENQLSMVTESDELKALCDKLGIRYDNTGNVILRGQY